MTQRLADERIKITLDGQPVELIPSLRAALRLARQFGTYGNLIAKIVEGDTQAIAATISEGANTQALTAVLQAIEARGVLSVVATIKTPLIAFVMSLAGLQLPTSRRGSVWLLKPKFLNWRNRL